MKKKNTPEIDHEELGKLKKIALNYKASPFIFRLLNELKERMGDTRTSIINHAVIELYQKLIGTPKLK